MRLLARSLAESLVVQHTRRIRIQRHSGFRDLSVSLIRVGDIIRLGQIVPKWLVPWDAAHCEPSQLVASSCIVTKAGIR